MYIIYQSKCHLIIYSLVPFSENPFSYLVLVLVYYGKLKTLPECELEHMFFPLIFIFSAFQADFGMLSL